MELHALTLAARSYVLLWNAWWNWIKYSISLQNFHIHSFCRSYYITHLILHTHNTCPGMPPPLHTHTHSHTHTSLQTSFIANICLCRTGQRPYLFPSENQPISHDILIWCGWTFINQNVYCTDFGTQYTPTHHQPSTCTHFTHISHLASFPGHTQLSVACSIEKQERVSFLTGVTSG